MKLSPEQLAEIRERHRRDSNECADVKDADEIHNDRQALLNHITALEAEVKRAWGSLSSRRMAEMQRRMEAAEAKLEKTRGVVYMQKDTLTKVKAVKALLKQEQE